MLVDGDAESFVGVAEDCCGHRSMRLIKTVSLGFLIDLINVVEGVDSFVI